tara:strand:+ start:41 stop:481 length:441 start_codon:yes stop_codon:yes gene_type:complete
MMNFMMMGMMIQLAAFGQDLTGNGWVDFIVILGGLCAIALLLKKVKDEFWPGESVASKMLITPSPLSVKKAETVATKDDIAEVKEEIDKIWDEVKDQRTVNRTALGKIHKRIDDLAKQSDTMSGEMKGELKGINTNLEILLNRAIK